MARIYVKVEPNSDEFRVEEGQFPTFYLEEPAENGRANKELCKRLEQILGAKPGIISGHNSKRKKIAVDLDEKIIEDKLSDYING